MGNPVIFIHGIGATGKVWKEFAIPNHHLFYITFVNRFANPAKQVPELAAYIDQVLKATGSNKVILVGHSMGALVARQYLAENMGKQRVEKLITFSSPNLGSMGLAFNWVPLSLIFIGLVGYGSLFTFSLLFIGLFWEIISYSRGVLLLSPAAWAMRKDSRFLKELNTKPLPKDVKYAAVLSDNRMFPNNLVNWILFREGGDGAIALSSQKLSGKSVPNFKELDYKELTTDLPHFKIPRNCESAVLKALSI